MDKANQAGKTEYKTIFHFLGAFLATALVFSTALSMVIVILGYGLRMIQHGLPMCELLIRERMWGQVPYTACGCAPACVP